MLEQIWALLMDALIVLLMESLRGYRLDNHWVLLKAKCFALMKSSKLGLSDGKVIGNILGNVDVITLCFDVGTDMGYLYE